MTNDDNMSATLPPAGSVAERVMQIVAIGLAEPLLPGLYLVATPIGNLADITVRAIGVLERADVIACEDTRHSKKLFAQYGITGSMLAYHDHNAAAVRPQLLESIEKGKSVALISDAGTPLISDPGFKLVKEARQRNLFVTSLPGACAPIVGLTLSGQPTDRFFFEGFLPAKQAQRIARLQELASQRVTLVFFETAKRVRDSLKDMFDVLGDREVAVTRELTKKFETVVSGRIGALSTSFSDDDCRGEFVIVVGPPVVPEVRDEDIVENLEKALETMSLRDAARDVAVRVGVARSRVYSIGLALKDKNRES